jgi:hypothetical protein
MKPIQNLQSNVIAFLRFPLIVGVLFVHNNVSEVPVQSMEFGSSEHLPVFHFCSSLVPLLIVRIPLFFFISGFLFFRNIDNFTGQAYMEKLRNRGKTLLIPYLFWNITALLVYYIAHNIPAFDGWFKEHVEYTLQYLLESMWEHPKSGQLWFVRDLMVAVVLTPVIHFCIKKAKVYGVLLLGALWFLNCWFEVAGLSIVAVFFFTAGAWFGCNKRNLVDDFDKVKRWAYILYPLLVVADMLTMEYAANPFIHKAGMIAGIAFWFNLVACLLRTKKVKVNQFLTSSVFFLFAIHDPYLLSKIRKVIYVIFNPQSDWVITALYFLLVLVTVLIALGLYGILRRFMPRFTAVITGGR